MISNLIFMFIGILIGIFVCGFSLMITELYNAKEVERDFFNDVYTPPERTVTIEGYEDE